MARAATDILLVSLGSTTGLRVADDEFAASLRRCGATVVVARAKPVRRRLRTFALTDLAWALSARRVAYTALRTHRPQAVIYSTTTAAAFAPIPGAIRFDAPAADNRPGRHGFWQRPLERKRFREAGLLLPLSDLALKDLECYKTEKLVIPIAIEPSNSTEGAPVRDIAAITYAADPHKKGLDQVLYAWQRCRSEGETLLVVGTSGDAAEGVEYRPLCRPAEYRALLRRARVYVTAPRREDYGIAQLEALADGCVLVSTPAPGPYVALSLARKLDTRLVVEDLAVSLRTALDDPVVGYTERALRLLEPFRQAQIDAVIANELLPRLLAKSPASSAATPALA